MQVYVGQNRLGIYVCLISYISLYILYLKVHIYYRHYIIQYIYIYYVCILISRLYLGFRHHVLFWLFRGGPIAINGYMWCQLVFQLFWLGRCALKKHHVTQSAHAIMRMRNTG